MVTPLLSAALLLAVLVASSAGIAIGEGEDARSGSGTVEQVKDISVVSLSGSPRDIGYWHGKLLGGRMLETEAAFKKLMPPIPGGVIGEWLVRMFIMLRLGSIEKHLTEAELEEMKGMADAGPDEGRGYRDLLYYHVLQDIGQNYACTGGAACGRASALGGPVAGRNFDMNRDGVLDPLKTVFFYESEHGNSYATVAWPGMVGAVTGMNESGLCVMVFSARSEGTSLTGVPVAFLARRVLAEAADVDGAVEIVRSARRMGPNTFLIVDRERAVAVEFDTERVGVRETEDGIISVSNHFLCEPFSYDEKNAHQARYTDSRQRYERMLHLLQSGRRVRVVDMASSLRDHSGPEGRVMAWGDPASINNVKDAHSVVFDPAGRRFWVSTPPSALGEFIGFRLTDGGMKRIKDIPAADYQTTDDGLDAVDSYELLRGSMALKVEGFTDGAMTLAWQAMGVDPSNYMAAVQYGRLCMGSYKYREAYEAFDSAVMHAPECYPAMAEALAGRGEAARKLGLRENAVSDFKGVLDMDCSEDANEAAYEGLKFL